VREAWEIVEEGYRASQQSLRERVVGPLSPESAISPRERYSAIALLFVAIEVRIRNDPMSYGRRELDDDLALVERSLGMRDGVPARPVRMTLRPQPLRDAIPFPLLTRLQNLERCTCKPILKAPDVVAIMEVAKRISC
jgi:hypothetical protein